jgi:ribonuclease R
MSSKSKKDVDFNSTKDPYAQREAEKYENPIPSRELILQFIEHAGKPLSRVDIAEAFSLENEDDLEALRRRLRAMERDGQLLFNRAQQYCLVNNKDLIVGRIIGHADGFGFVRPDDGSDDLYLSPREMNPLLHNDRAMVRVAGIDKKGRREGAVVEILERNTHQIVGRLYKEDGFVYVVPDNKRGKSLLPKLSNNRLSYANLSAELSKYWVIISLPAWKLKWRFVLMNCLIYGRRNCWKKSSR